jgi:hypothetical protein
LRLAGQRQGSRLPSSQRDDYGRERHAPSPAPLCRAAPSQVRRGWTSARLSAPRLLSVTSPFRTPSGRHRSVTPNLDERGLPMNRPPEAERGENHEQDNGGGGPGQGKRGGGACLWRRRCAPRTLRIIQDCGQLPQEEAPRKPRALSLAPSRSECLQVRGVSLLAPPHRARRREGA